MSTSFMPNIFHHGTNQGILVIEILIKCLEHHSMYSEYIFIHDFLFFFLFLYLSYINKLNVSMYIEALL